MRDGRPPVRALIVGVGAAGIAVAKILLAAGVRDVIGCDSRGALHRGREDYETLPAMERWLADEPNREGRAGGPADVLEGVDLFVGLSGARVMSSGWAEADAGEFGYAKGRHDGLPAIGSGAAPRGG
jgi:malic enzyme